MGILQRLLKVANIKSNLNNYCGLSVAGLLELFFQSSPVMKEHECAPPKGLEGHLTSRIPTPSSRARDTLNSWILHLVHNIAVIALTNALNCVTSHSKIDAKRFAMFVLCHCVSSHLLHIHPGGICPPVWEVKIRVHWLFQWLCNEIRSVL